MDAAERKKQMLKEQKKKQKKIQKTAKYASPEGMRKKKIRNGIIIAIICVIIAAVVFVIVSFANGSAQRRLTAFTVDGEKFSIADYNYWYTIFYDQMVSVAYTVPDRETVVNNAESIISVAKAVQKSGAVLDGEDLESYNTALSSLRSESQNYSGGVAAFYNTNYGFATNEEIVMKNYEYQLLAMRYRTEYMDSLDYTDEDYDRYYEEEGSTTLDMVSFRSCIFSADDKNTVETAYVSFNDALAAAQAFDAKVSDEESFVSALREELASVGQDPDSFDYDSTLETDFMYSNANSFLSEIFEWMFSHERQANDHAVFTANVAGTPLVYEILVTEPAHREEYKTVDMRHILVATVDENGDPDESLEKSAPAVVSNILREWDESDRTDATFALMAAAYSDDTSGSQNGGLIEQVTKGQLAEEIDEWLFNAARMVGDYGTAQSDNGYHILYYKGTNIEKWKVDAQMYMMERDFEAETYRIIEEYSITSSSNNFLIDIFSSKTNGDYYTA